MTSKELFEMQNRNSLLTKPKPGKAQWQSGVAKLFDDRRRSFVNSEVRNNTAGMEPKSVYYNNLEDSSGGYTTMSFAGLQPKRFITPAKVLNQRKQSVDQDDERVMNMTGGF